MLLISDEYTGATVVVETTVATGSTESEVVVADESEVADGKPCGSDTWTMVTSEVVVLSAEKLNGPLCDCTSVVVCTIVLVVIRVTRPWLSVIVLSEISRGVLLRWGGGPEFSGAGYG